MIYSSYTYDEESSNFSKNASLLGCSTSKYIVVGVFPLLVVGGAVQKICERRRGVSCLGWLSELKICFFYTVIESSS